MKKLIGVVLTIFSILTGLTTHASAVSLADVSGNYDVLVTEKFKVKKIENFWKNVAPLADTFTISPEGIFSSEIYQGSATLDSKGKKLSLTLSNSGREHFESLITSKVIGKFEQNGYTVTDLQSTITDAKPSKCSVDKKTNKLKKIQGISIKGIITGTINGEFIDTSFTYSTKIAILAVGDYSSETIFVPGEDVALFTQTVGSTGGVITVSGTGTHLDGAEIAFPAGALSDSMDITVGYNYGSLNLPEGLSSSSSSTPETLSIRPNGDSNFSQPVEITIPYTDENNIPFPFYVDANGRLHAVLVTNINRTNKTFTFITMHASLWTWIVDLVTDSPDQDTEFRPADDGFKIRNEGSPYNSGGECFGMTAFAQWYFGEKMSSSGDFYDKYMDIICSDLTGQEIIATRAHSAINQTWTIDNFVLPIVNTTDEDRYNYIAAILRATRRPVVLGLSEEDPWGGSKHAVVAFGLDGDDGQLFIYDPNSPGSTRQIIYDTSAKDFQQYVTPSVTYKNFFLIGTGTSYYDLKESFDNIFEDAEQDFNSDNMPHITITSHHNGETVDDRNIFLEGVVESRDALIGSLELYFGNSKIITNVEADGSFIVQLSLDAGEQYIHFIAKDTSGNPITPNNLDCNPFLINVDVEKAEMLVTLTWNKYDTDLDLYVIDPRGDYSAYYNKETSDGGELDIDDVDGYGPEHWTLSTSDIVRWDQASYRVRVHYYSDHGNGGTNYRLAVKLYEGTDREVEYVTYGYLYVNNSYNSDPNDIGADWAEFPMSIVLTSPNSDTTVSTASKPFRDDLLSTPIHITTEIPAPDIQRALKNQ